MIDSMILSVHERHAAHAAQLAARVAQQHELATRIYTARQIEGFSHCYSTTEVERAVAYVRSVITSTH